MSGDWKRGHGSRTEARRESNGFATGPYHWRASPRLYKRKRLGRQCRVVHGAVEDMDVKSITLLVATAFTRRSRA